MCKQHDFCVENTSDRTLKIAFAWEQCRLGDISPIRGGYAFQSSNYEDEGIPVVRISNILTNGFVGGDFAFHNEINGDEAFVLKQGDAVIAMSGATTGKVSVLNLEKACKYYQNQRVGLFLELGHIDYSFITTLVSSGMFSNQLSNVLVSGAQPNVSAKGIGSFEFCIPNAIKEQGEIGSFFTKLEKLITLHQRTQLNTCVLY